MRGRDLASNDPASAGTTVATKLSARPAMLEQNKEMPKLNQGAQKEEKGTEQDAPASTWSASSEAHVPASASTTVAPNPLSQRAMQKQHEQETPREANGTEQDVQASKRASTSPGLVTTNLEKETPRQEQMEQDAPASSMSHAASSEASDLALAGTAVATKPLQEQHEVAMATEDKEMEQETKEMDQNASTSTASSGAYVPASVSIAVTTHPSALLATQRQHEEETPKKDKEKEQDSPTSSTSAAASSGANNPVSVGTAIVTNGPAPCATREQHDEAKPMEKQRTSTEDRETKRDAPAASLSDAASSKANDPACAGTAVASSSPAPLAYLATCASQSILPQDTLHKRESIHGVVGGGKRDIDGSCAGNGGDAHTYALALSHTHTHTGESEAAQMLLKVKRRAVARFGLDTTLAGQDVKGGAHGASGSKTMNSTDDLLSRFENMKAKEVEAKRSHEIGRFLCWCARVWGGGDMCDVV